MPFNMSPCQVVANVSQHLFSDAERVHWFLALTLGSRLGEFFAARKHSVFKFFQSQAYSGPDTRSNRSFVRGWLQTIVRNAPQLRARILLYWVPSP